MAVVTREAGSYLSGLCVWEYDYDNVTLKLREFRCKNDSTQRVRGTLTSSSTGQTVSQDVDTNTTLQRAAGSVSWTSGIIPTNIANRFNLSVDPRGRLDGMDFSCQFPV